MSSTIIFPNNILSTEGYSPNMKNDNKEKQQQYEGINQLQQIIQFGQQRKHTEKGCEQCHVIAMYYRHALYELKLANEVSEEKTLTLIWEMTQMLLEHMETRVFHYLSWFDMMARDLWQFAKWLKEDKNEADIENAIRITIYHCRACLYQQENNLIKARIYFRKCLSLETSYEIQQLLQNTATAFLEQHPSIEPSLSSNSLFGGYNHHQPRHHNSRQSSISSTASTTSSNYASSTASDNTSLSSTTAIVSPEKVCGNCGLEKKAMPVCAKCKTQRYCSAKCLKNHKPIHDTVCQKQ